MHKFRLGNHVVGVVPLKSEFVRLEFTHKLVEWLFRTTRGGCRMSSGRTLTEDNNGGGDGNASDVNGKLQHNVNCIKTLCHNHAVSTEICICKAISLYIYIVQRDILVVI